MLEPSAAELSAQVRQLQATLNHVGAFVYVKDLQARYTFANQMVCDLFGRTLQQIVGCTDDAFFDASTSAQLRLNDRRVMDQRQRVELEETNVSADGQTQRIYWSVKMPLLDTTGAVVGLSGISTDITEQRRLEAELRDQKRLLDSVLNNVDALVYMKDRQRRYLYANVNAATLYGQTQASILGKADAELVPQDQADRFGLMDQLVLGDGQKTMGEETFLDAQGVERHYWSIKVPLEKDGAIESYVGISTDITEVVQLKEKFRGLANTDALTGLLSRRYLLERADSELKRARRLGLQIAVITFDIDWFKLVNDTSGHAVGDRAIIAAVDACKTCLRMTDLFGRVGGDEFVVVAVDTDLRGAVGLAERMRENVSDALILDSRDARVPITCSFGVAMSDDDATLDDLLSRADAMLYQAKQHGRNQVRFQSTPRPPSA